jgi:cytidylate kinase
MVKKIVVAIDGHSSCGKSTMAKGLACAIGYAYIDTGAMYRAVTLYALQHRFFERDGLDVVALARAMDDVVVIDFKVNPENGRSGTFLNGESVEREIRGMEVASRVSEIAALSFVRSALVERQRAMGMHKGIVMDGRDIGTVVFPDAELKIFVTASSEIRAMRRLKELRAKGENTSFEEVLYNIKSRDYHDINRVIDPLRKADDAIELDNTHMTIGQQQEWLLNQYNRVLAVNDND